MKTGYVYFMFTPFRDGMHAVKIGWSTNPIVRLASLQSGNPEQIWLQAIVRMSTSDPLAGTGPMSLEKRLHKQFAQWHIGGEWYVVSIPIDDYIREHAEAFAA